MLSFKHFSDKPLPRAKFLKLHWHKLYVTYDVFQGSPYYADPQGSPHTKGSSKYQTNLLRMLNMHIIDHFKILKKLFQNIAHLLEQYFFQKILGILKDHISKTRYRNIYFSLVLEHCVSEHSF